LIDVLILWRFFDRVDIVYDALLAFLDIPIRMLDSCSNNCFDVLAYVAGSVSVGASTSRKALHMRESVCASKSFRPVGPIIRILDLRVRCPPAACQKSVCSGGNRHPPFPSSCGLAHDGAIQELLISGGRGMPLGRRGGLFAFLIFRIVWHSTHSLQM